MQGYRAYLLGKNGCIVSAKEIVCANDAEAMQQAKQFVDGHDVEVWSGARVVGKITYTGQPFENLADSTTE